MSAKLIVNMLCPSYTDKVHEKLFAFNGKKAGPIMLILWLKEDK